MGRRQRLVLLWSGVSAAAAAGIGAFVALRPREAPRTAEEPAQAITSELSRSLPADAPRIVFTDVTEAAGIRFVHSRGKRSRLLPEDMGSGAAWGDFDGDGDPDLYLVNQPGPLSAPIAPDAPTNRLYRNDGGEFTDVTEAAGVGARAFGMGALFADLDGDGLLDLYVTNRGPNLFYRNRGDGSFEDSTERAGIGDPRWSVTAAAGDYDLDGDLDLYVGNYVRFFHEGTDPGKETEQYGAKVPFTLNPSSYPPEPNTLYRNRGDGTFEDATAFAGVADAEGRTLSTTFADLDLDGLPDLYNANDVSKNALFRNRGDGTFEDVSASSWAADYRGAMGLAVADVDADGDLDLFLTHWIAQENALYENLFLEMVGKRPDPLKFMDVADAKGLGQIALDFVGWGTEFLDFDHDGRWDLFVANGHTFEEGPDRSRLVPQKPQLFWNGGERGFFEVAPISGEALSRPRVARGAAFADFDGDGDSDVLVTENYGPAALLRNDGGERNAWLTVRVRGRGKNAFGVGAKVFVEAEGRTNFREVGAGNSYACGNSLDLHFGLGPAAKADRVEVRYLSGAVALVRDVPSRRVLVVEEPAEGGRMEVTLADPPPSSNEPAESTDPTERRRRIASFWAAFNEATEKRLAGDAAGAEAGYRRALEIGPDHERSLHDLANLLASGGRFDEALALLRRLVAVHPSSAQGWSRIGAILSGGEPGAPTDLRAAKEAYEQALRLNREETGPIFHLGRVCALLGEEEEALRRLDEASRLNPRHVDALLLAGEIRLRRGELRPALEDFLRAARAAEPVTPPKGVPGEGDTKKSLEEAAKGIPAFARALRGLHRAAVACGGYPPEVPTELRLEAGSPVLREKD